MAELKHGQYLRNDRGDTSSSDHSTYVEFFLDTIPDEAASIAAGRQVWKEEERVRIYFPGNQQTRPVFKVTQEHIDRWSKQYEAFKSGIEMSPDGIPLEQWAFLRKSQVLELKAMGFQTVEQIAAMNDLTIQKINPGGRHLKNNAIAYLDDAEAGALLAKTTAENDKLNTLVAEQGRKLDEQAAMLNDVFAQLQTLKNAPSAIATAIPGMSDPMEALRMGQPHEPVAQSSLASIAEPRRGPGRPRKDQAA